MPSNIKLILRFGTTSGEKNFTYSYADDDVAANNVKTAMQTMITNGDIFKYPPLTAISAKVQVTSTTDIDIT